MILEPRAGECPECGHKLLLRTTTWINEPSEQLELGELLMCKDCNYIWKKPFALKSGDEEDIV